MMDDETPRAWIPTEGGTTIGAAGPEGGRVVQDVEWADPDDPEDADARLTVEVSGEATVVVAQLHGGWMRRVERFATSTSAEQGTQWLRTELERLAGMIPYEEDRDVPRKVRELLAAVDDSLAIRLPGAEHAAGS